MKPLLKTILFLGWVFLTHYFAFCQGHWVACNLQTGMSGSQLTIVGDNCILHTRSTSRYIYFFDINCGNWTEFDFGSTQKVNAVEAGKNVLLAITETKLLVAYSALLAKVDTLRFNGNIIQSTNPSKRGYGCGEQLAFAWTDENTLYIFDAKTGKWISQNFTPVTNASGYISTINGNSYFAMAIIRTVPFNRIIAYSLYTKTFNYTDQGGGIIDIHGYFKDGFVCTAGGPPSDLLYNAYDSKSNQFHNITEIPPYGYQQYTYFDNYIWPEFTDKNVFGYSINRGTVASTPRNAKLMVYDISRAQWLGYNLDYEANELSSVYAAHAGGNALLFGQTYNKYPDLYKKFWIYSGSSGGFNFYETKIVGGGVFPGNNFFVAIGNNSAFFVNANTGFSLETQGIRYGFSHIARGSDFFSFSTSYLDDAEMEIWIYNAFYDSIRKIILEQEQSQTFAFTNSVYFFRQTKPTHLAYFYSVKHDSLIDYSLSSLGSTSSFSAIGVFAWAQSSQNVVVFDGANLEIIEKGYLIMHNCVSDSLILFSDGNRVEVYDANTRQFTSTDLGSSLSFRMNGGNTILIANSNFSKLAAYTKGQNSWFELIPEGSSIYNNVNNNTAVVLRTGKIYGFTPYNPTIIGQNQVVKHEKIITCSPNPFNNNVDINWLKCEGNKMQIDVFDSTGRMIFSTEIYPETSGNQITRLSTQSWKPGIYFCTCSMNNYKTTFKLIKIDCL